ncbi:sensor histidine kinase [Streptomyces sp. 147326]|uniref:sensor histidine kinase n=1 Tax=Streptomyces sp. 147326 TaxID=3074379 RepID=UPI0038572BC8
MDLDDRGDLHAAGGAQTSRRWHNAATGADFTEPVLAGALGSAFSVAAILISWQKTPYPWWVAVPAQVAGVLFLAAGLFVWTRQPGGSRMAKLLVAMGFTWYLGDLQFSGYPLLNGIGFWLFYLNAVVLAHLLLAYPDGRLRRRPERCTVVALYAVVLVTQGLRALTEDPLQPQMAGDPDAEYSVWAPVGSVLAIVLAGVVVVLVIRRWRCEPPPARRERGLFWAAVAFIGAVFAAGCLAAVAGAPAAFHSAMLLAYTCSLFVLGGAVLLGSLRVQIAHRSVSRMLTQLSSDRERPLRDVLAEALEDPTLTLHYRRANSNEYVNESGLPSPPPLWSEGRARTPVGPPGEPLAYLVHDAFLVERPIRRELLNAVVAAAVLHLDNARLQADNRARLHGIMQAEAAARSALSLALHDGSQHRLSTLQHLVGRALKHHDHASVVQELQAIAKSLHMAVNELREVTEGIYPSALDRGLRDALDPLVQHSPIPLTLKVAPTRWPAEVELTAYFIISEAVGNVHKHAAASQIIAVIADSEGRLALEVRDDGRGGAGHRPAGRGLRGMQERATVHGGTFAIHSPPQGGTTLKVVLPCV